MTNRIVLAAALVLAASVPARGAARFLVGASAADITPPLAATAASNPANCDASGLYDGPHLLSLEEPYRDTNGNGQYDAGDPTAQPPVPPEPFLDCPTGAGTASTWTAAAATTASRPRCSTRSGRGPSW